MKDDIYRIKPREDAVVVQMDRMITVTPAPMWLILLGSVIIVVSVLIWSCTGWITEQVSATGIYHPGASAEGEIIAFLPMASGKALDTGMEVTLYVSGYNQQKYGHLKGTITYVDQYAATEEEMQKLLGSDALVRAYTQNNTPMMTVICKLQESQEMENGFYWSNQRGGKVTLHDGTFVSMSVITSKMRPIAVGIPALEQLFEDA